MRVHLTAMGCKLNQAEVDRFGEAFVAAGYGLTSDPAAAGVQVIHSCTVTQVADKKVRQLIRAARRANPTGIVLVSGCYAHTSPGVVAGMPEVDAVVGQGDDIVAVAAVAGARPDPLGVGETPHPLPIQPGRTRAFVKIQDGCNDFCTFCIIPTARGRARSVPPDAVIADINRALSRGQHEIVLTGVSIGGYGDDIGTSLVGLIGRILAETAVRRLRITSLEPHDFDDRLVAFFADPRVCPHLHLCLQAGSDRMLRRMARRYTTARYAAIVAGLRSARPDIAITSDIIAGFPGETEDDAAATLAFMESIDLNGVHAFRYSPRAGTKATTYADQLPDAVKQQRVSNLIALGDRLAAAFRARQVGERRRVLFETRTADGWAGFTEHYVRTIVPATEPLRGAERIVTITEAGAVLHGRLEAA